MIPLYVEKTCVACDTHLVNQEATSAWAINSAVRVPSLQGGSRWFKSSIAHYPSFLFFGVLTQLVINIEFAIFHCNLLVTVALCGTQLVSPLVSPKIGVVTQDSF